MGLAIDGNVVHGIAVAGNAFTPASKKSLIGKKVSGLIHATARTVVYTNGAFDFSNLFYSSSKDTGTIVAEWNFQYPSPLVAVKYDSGYIANDGNNICWFDVKDLTVED